MFRRDHKFSTQVWKQSQVRCKMNLSEIIFNLFAIGAGRNLLTPTPYSLLVLTRVRLYNENKEIDFVLVRWLTGYAGYRIWSGSHGDAYTCSFAFDSSEFVFEIYGHVTQFRLKVELHRCWDEMCWRELWDVGDGFCRFCHQHSLSFNISVGPRQLKDVTNMEILSLTSKNCHQHKVTNIDLSPTSM